MKLEQANCVVSKAERSSFPLESKLRPAEFQITEYRNGVRQYFQIVKLTRKYVYIILHGYCEMQNSIKGILDKYKIKTINCTLSAIALLHLCNQGLLLFVFGLVLVRLSSVCVLCCQCFWIVHS